MQTSKTFFDPFCIAFRIEGWKMSSPMYESTDREVAVFNAALQLPLEQRSAYLDQACDGDDALRLRITALLKVHDDVGAFLENPTPESSPAGPASGLGSPICASVLGIEKTGDRIGRYKLLQQIGEGGCGVVYMAEQEEPVRRKVAVKVIKLGMDTKHVIARFEAERQALALMDHPNIAKVLDAGATETGRPFFVMELVRGVKITEYCDQHRLATAERLKLFTQICQAIQHAHQKGIIHRDIKPSNILVADHDGVPVPKVIDFGIAKATTDQPLTDKTLFTALEQFIGTPAYMSPEQARLSGLDIDTRTDIYSLGVLLYELLTGKTPFDARQSLAAGVEEMRRTIRDEEPERPSTALSTMLATDLTAVAQRRQSDAPKLVHLIRGDLDWIVMKALEKDRVRRYETAYGLALDVERHLADEPVQARPPSSLYRFRKMIRRNKGAFAAGVGITAALVAGLVVSTRLYLMESTAHRRALIAEQRARQGEVAAQKAEQETTAELWRSYLAQARAARFSGQPGRRFDCLAVLAKAAAIRFAPELRDEAIASLALADLKFVRRIDVASGVLDPTLERYAAALTNTGEVILRATSDDHELFRLPARKGPVQSIAIGRFSRGGRFLPVWHGEQSLSVWDLERRAVILDLAGLPPKADFQPGDERIAVADKSTVSIYRLSTGQKEMSFSPPFGKIHLRFDPTGRKLAVTSSEDGRLYVVDANSGATLLMTTNADWLGETAWNPNASIIAVVGRITGFIYLLDAETGQRLRELKGHQNEPGSLEFSHDGELLISSGWDGGHLWQVRTGEHLAADGSSGNFQSFASDDRTCGQSDYHGRLELLSVSSGREARRWHAGEEDRNHKVLAYSDDGKWLAFGTEDFVEIFDTHTGDLLAALPTGAPLGLCFQKDGRGLLVCGDRGLFRWPIRLANEANEFRIGPVEAVGLPGVWEQASRSEDGRVFAAFHDDHACLFDAETMQEIAKTGACGDKDQFRYLTLSSDGQKLATGGWHDGVVNVWDSHSGALLKEFKEPDWKAEESPTPMFEPNGNSLVVASWSNYCILETNSWTVGARIPWPDLAYIAISHRDRVLAAASGLRAIQLRDLDTGDLLATLQSPVSSHLTAMAFSPDDTQLAVVHGRTRDLLVWDLRLLREDLKKMGMDWSRAAYPPAVEAVSPRSSRIRVLTNSESAILRHG